MSLANHFAWPQAGSTKAAQCNMEESMSRSFLKTQTEMREYVIKSVDDTITVEQGWNSGSDALAGLQVSESTITWVDT